MKRDELEHVIRASGNLLHEDAVVIVGSQAILGSVPDDLPKEVTLSAEVDVMAIDDPTGEKALRINGALGELTRFNETFGYYAEGVEDALCRFPAGWRDRLIEVNTPNTNGVTGLCPEPHDLCVAKLLAGRDKDLKYVAALLRSGHIKPELLLERLGETESTDDEFRRIVGFVKRVARPGRRNKARHVVRAAEKEASDRATGGSDDRSS